MDVLCLFFRCTARRCPVKNELFFINGAVDGTSGERFLTITFRISSVKYHVYFLVVCLFFPHSRVDFQKKLDEKQKKNTSCPNDEVEKKNRLRRETAASPSLRGPYQDNVENRGRFSEATSVRFLRQGTVLQNLPIGDSRRGAFQGLCVVVDSARPDGARGRNHTPLLTTTQLR